MGKKRSAEVEEEVDIEKDEEIVLENDAADVDASHWTREIVLPLPVDGIQKQLKIISWNVNGLKALVTTKKQVLISLVEKHQPDVLCFQETKIQDVMIDLYTDLLDGYEAYWNCSTVKKGYSGTAIFLKKSTIFVPTGLQHSGSLPSDQPAKKQAKLSAFFTKAKAAPEPVAVDATKAPAATSAGPNHVASVVKVSYDFEDEKKGHEGEGRTITVELDRFVLVACYVPNSGEGLRRLDYRIDEWEPHMRGYLRALAARKPVVYTGDLNCGHLDLDIHNPTAKHITKQSGLTPAERSAFAQMLQECDLRDAFRHRHPDAKGQFTYWSVRAFNRAPNKGIRLDYFLCSNSMFPDEAGIADSSSAVTVHDSYILHQDTAMDEETNFIVQFGCGSTVGGRPYQEDRLVATRLNGSADHTYFAVFDGHGGDRCSEFLSRNFHKEIMNHPKFNALPIVALQETWATFDEKCLSNFKIVESSDPKHVLPGDGSTATACVINLNDIYLTNCGDSAAYVIHQDGSTECLTEDHGTNNKEEIARCVKAGGSLKPQFYHEPYPFPLCFMGRSVAAKPRMLPGGLLVTRSFGDFNAKLDYLGGRRGVVVSTHGRVSYINAKKTPPRYLVLASDGVWDVLSIAEVAAMIQRYFERRAALGLSLSSSASQLSSAAMNIDLYAPEQKSGKASPKGSSGSGSGKMSPRKVSPMVRPGSLTDLGNHNQNHNEDTASLVEAELINARYTDLSAELNEVATLIVNAAAASPKWKSLGCTADNTSMIIVSFTHKPPPAVPETLTE